jgi:hypothetical protein
LLIYIKIFYFQLDIQKRANNLGLVGFPAAGAGKESKKGMDAISVQKIKNVTRRFV